MIYKKIIKLIFNLAGLAVSKKNTGSIWNELKINLVLDVGANAGQYGLRIRNEGYKGEIISFEPLPDVYHQLLKNSKNDKNWSIYERCALGSHNGVMDINVSKNSQSSSFLKIKKNHIEAAPESHYVGSVKTNVVTLDSIFGKLKAVNKKTLLKIDVQGYEDEVLKGVKENIKNLYAIEIELSTVELYENQRTYEYFFELMDGYGLRLWSLEPVFRNPISGQVLQFDCLFVKK
ncbi:FkbM family methyltransferase [Polynucleobacter paneuropaeus]|nr:FkbM family methyltransferase [Polynucleobacter paneuropaeus]